MIAIARLQVLAASVLLVLLTATLLPAYAQRPDPQESRPLWKDLSQRQQRLLSPFAKQWDSWKPDEKRVWMSLAARFPSLSDINKAKAKLRIDEWARLTPRQRNTARRNYQLAREKRHSDRMAEWERYQQMTQEQKSVLRRSSQSGGMNGGSSTRSGLADDSAQPLIRR